ncbi:MAG: glycoside hydrolase family 3 C-terminal domain-containing protein [Ignavibacteriae bacterium]|nr:glycoside hydrolase family 3 C-terminal domain-containing protein [Ignavibacteriota bacterium]
MKTTPCRSILIATLGLAFLGSSPLDPQSASTEQKVKSLLAQMTLEEKVGQMTQVTIDVVSAGSDGRQEPHALDMKKLEHAIIDRHLGSLINVGPQAYTLEHWYEVITAIQDVATQKTRLKIPILYGIDAIHGVNYTHGGTLFPQAIALASTWNIDLAKREGEITACEMRASGIPWNFYPVLDIGRQPLWARFWETYGEDVFLATAMGRMYIEGHQGADISAPTKGATCLKHYVGYSFPLNGKDRTPAWMSERTLREYFLPMFEAAVAAGAPTVMVNSSEIDGIPGHANYHLLTEVLKGEMKFNGFVVSDWEDIRRLYTRDRVATSPKDAVRMAVMAGIDMSMVPLDFSFYDLLLECVKDGVVPMSRINDAVSRILTVKYQLGIFENPYPDKTLKAQFAGKEFAQANLDAARECITMTKNDKGLLPLAKTMKVLVTGPTATSLSAMNSGWTITWQGDREDLYPKDKPTVLQAIQKEIGPANVTYVPGTTLSVPIDIPAAVEAAKKADVAVVCLGEGAYCETPGNINDLTLNKAQLDLASAIARTGKPVVVVMLEGRPRVINSIVGDASAILVAMLPGMEGGRALADVLFGDANPSGKLAFTYPRHPSGFTTYDYKPLEFADINSYDPQWAFGFGLSYTTFAYSDLSVSKKSITNDDSVGVSVKVKNTGKVAGKEVVQLYLCDMYGSVSRPNKQIKGFAKVMLQPGEERQVDFVLRQHDLSFIGVANKRIVEPGSFKIMIDKLSTEFVLENGSGKGTN